MTYFGPPQNERDFIVALIGFAMILLVSLGTSSCATIKPSMCLAIKPDLTVIENPDGGITLPRRSTADLLIYIEALEACAVR